MSVSKSSRNYLLLVLAALVQGVFGHTYLSSLYLGDQALAEGDCMRPHPQTAYDYPIPLVDQADMTCGWLPAANRAANRKCPVSAGSKIGLQWWHTSPGDDVVEATHAGPLMIYLAKSETGSGNVWFKVYEDGFRDGAWAVDRLLANRGRVDFTLPTDIEPGNYLLRGEILALHGAYALNGVQPYVGCAELTISGNGNAKPAGVAIPGVYKNTDAGMLFSRYQPFSVYNIPGPAVYKSGSNNNNNNNAAPSTSAPTVAPPATAPTSRPTYAPVTSAPVTSAPTYPPSNNNNNNNNNGNTIKVGLNGGSSVWWVGAIVSGGAETTVKVEMMDNGSVKNWVAMKDEGYAYTYNNGVLLVTPISLRVTSSTGKQVVLTNIFSSFSTGNYLIDTGKTYSSPSNPSTSAPTEKPTQKPTSAPVTSAPVTSAPVTSAPVTSAPTQKPTNAPSGNAKITFLSGASEWWFAVSISADVSSVEVKDSAAYTSYKALASDKWGQDAVYSFSTSGAPLVTPISVKVTSKSGKVSTATVSSISANTVVELGSL